MPGWPAKRSSTVQPFYIEHTCMSLNDINRLSTTSVWKSFGFSSNMRCNLSSSCVWGGRHGGHVSEER